MHAANIQAAKRNDRLARRAITLGGVILIVCVLAILALIAKVALPLFLPARATLLNSFPAQPAATNLPASARIVAVGLDDNLENAFCLDERGSISFFDIRQGRIIDTVRLAPPTNDVNVASITRQGPCQFGVLWRDGALTVDEVLFPVVFDEQGRRHAQRQVERRAVAPALPNAPLPVYSAASTDREGTVTRVDILPGGRLAGLTMSHRETSPAQNENISASKALVFADELPGAVVKIALDHAGAALYGATTNGYLLRWQIDANGVCALKDSVLAFPDSRALTSLALVYGDASLAVGDARGGVTVWSPTRTTGISKEKKLRRIHALPKGSGEISAIQPSGCNKSLVGLDAAGYARLYYTTSERLLLTVRAPSGIRHAGLSSNARGLIAYDNHGQILVWQLHNPHPEISWRALFGQVWYEGFDEPGRTWQSSAATDDAETKFSLVPLLFGTLKGAFYAMLFSAPLALLGAIYTGYFTGFGIRRIVKPTIEIMAAIPSVVLGFLAALWFAPFLERWLLSFFIGSIAAPLALVLTMLVWQRIRSVRFFKRVERGGEFGVAAFVLILAFLTARGLTPLCERLFFDGNFNLWLFAEGGIRYDLRNCIVIAFALGFAVIPIMFTLMEDALSNVPYTFTAASLALGASRWQTLWRVVLPSASPGIFAAVMIGLGRAVGETMIVLMATGNTPILDWSPFNGMRTLSANIAVEIPEAPLDGTLYRLLFLTAVMLFMMTFAINTLAEVVRQRLRRQYGRY